MIQPSHATTWRAPGLAPAPSQADALSLRNWHPPQGRLTASTSAAESTRSTRREPSSSTSASREPTSPRRAASATASRGSTTAAGGTASAARSTAGAATAAALDDGGLGLGQEALDREELLGRNADLVAGVERGGDDAGRGLDRKVDLVYEGGRRQRPGG